MSIPPSMPGAIALNDPPMMGPPPGMEMPGESPSMDQAADLLRKATAISTPEIEPAPVVTTELPGGWISPAGVLVKTAEVKELNGFAEERLSRLDMGKNVASYVTELLLLGVVRIGDEVPTRDLLKNLLIGDRDALVLAIRQATYGNDVEFKLDCTACGEESDIRVEIDKDVEVTFMEDPLVRVFDVELRNGAAKVTLLTGVAQEAFSENIGKRHKPKSTQRCLPRAWLRLTEYLSVEKTTLCERYPQPTDQPLPNLLPTTSQVRSSKRFRFPALRVARSIRSRWVSQTCFVSRETTLYSNYAALLIHYPNWKPADVKEMSPRERRYWQALAEWVFEKRASG